MEEDFITPVLDDIPVDDSAEPEDAEVGHEATEEDVKASLWPDSEGDDA